MQNCSETGVAWKWIKKSFAHWSLYMINWSRSAFAQWWRWWRSALPLPHFYDDHDHGLWRWWCGSAFAGWWSARSAFARWWQWWREVGGVPEQNSLGTCFYLVLSSTLHCHGHDPGHGQHHHFHHHHYQCHPPAHHHHHHHNHRQYWDFECHPHYNHHRILAQIKDDSQKIPLFKEHKPESNITAPECLKIVQSRLRMPFFSELEIVNEVGREAAPRTNDHIILLRWGNWSI